MRHLQRHIGCYTDPYKPCWVPEDVKHDSEIARCGHAKYAWTFRENSGLRPVRGWRRRSPGGG
jgi:hypothetical protein